MNKFFRRNIQKFFNKEEVTVSEYLLRYAVLDATCDKCKRSVSELDGFFVPLSVAIIAADACAAGDLKSSIKDVYDIGMLED